MATVCVVGCHSVLDELGPHSGGRSSSIVIGQFVVGDDTSGRKWSGPSPNPVHRPIGSRFVPLAWESAARLRPVHVACTVVASAIVSRTGYLLRRCHRTNRPSWLTDLDMSTAACDAPIGVRQATRRLYRWWRPADFSDSDHVPVGDGLHTSRRGRVFPPANRTYRPLRTV
jgi:hypothetical protein